MKVETAYPALEYPASMLSKPFFDLTRTMLDCVRDHNFRDLAQICDDDFGIIDTKTHPDGAARLNGKFDK